MDSHNPVSSSSGWKISLDHVAIATKDPAKMKRVLDLLGLSDRGTEPVPSQGVLTHFLKPELSEAQIELLEPTVDNGVVAKYIDKRGPGIHHICFLVSDIEACSAVLRKNNIRLIYTASQNGAHGARVNFIHPESTGGVLIEISQK